MENFLINLGLVLLLVALNGYFVAAEFSLVSIRTTRVDQLVEEGNTIARFIQRSKQDPSRFLSASQTGITLASLALGWVGEPTISEMVLAVFAKFALSPNMVLIHTIATVIAFIVITYFHIVLGELVPKALALQRTEPTVLLTAWPMKYLTVAFTPFIIVLQRSTKWLLKQLDIEDVPEHHLVYSEEELKRIVSASHEVGILEAHEEDMLHKVFAFSDKVAREVMVPRPDINALPIDITWAVLLEEVREHAHTRFPVYENTIDNIVGVFHAKDLFPYLSASHQPEAFSLRPLLREVPFVPESKPVDDLLTELKKGKTQIAIVMDEFGGTAGLVTLEDLLEEIVGDISDEFDEEEPDLELLAPNHYKLDGRYRIADFNERFGTNLPTDDFDTMAGLVFGTLGREPQVGDEVELDNVAFTVQAMEGHRITRLLLRLRAEEKPDDEPPGMTPEP
jgi:CBS domain containing-hemolysin-like protein